MSNQTNLEGANKPIEGNGASSKFPYTETKKVFIKRKYTDPKLPERGTLVNSAEGYVEKIGGALANHGSTLPLGRKALTEEQEKAWFPQILGVSPAHTEWNTRLDNYWHNISVNVPLDGLILNCNIHYKDENDIGTPEVIADYILWQYCKLYSDVANNKADLHKSPKIRFYMWSAEEELQTKLSAHALADLAFKHRLNIEKDIEKSKAMLDLFDKPWDEDKAVRSFYLKEAQEANAKLFVQYAKDELLLRKGFVKALINAGVITSPLNSEVLMYGETFLGNTLAEVVAFVETADRVSLKTELIARLKESRK